MKKTDGNRPDTVDAHKFPNNLLDLSEIGFLNRRPIVAHALVDFHPTRSRHKRIGKPQP